MDRRTFLTGIGTVGALGTIGTGIAARESNAIGTRAREFMNAAGAGSATSRVSTPRAPKAGMVDGLVVGFLPVSPHLFNSRIGGDKTVLGARGSPWVKWAASSTNSVPTLTLDGSSRSGNQVDISIGALHFANEAATSPSLRSLGIVANFTLDDAPYSAFFDAWRFESTGSKSPPKSTQPLSFVAATPNRVALEIVYAFDPAATSSDVAGAGSMHLPIGAQSGSGGGLGAGLYVLATPSTSTGSQPDFGGCMFSGNVNRPLVSRSGLPLDFDYVTLAVRPLA